jgi:uncharacterized protein (DUF952 family)
MKIYHIVLPKVWKKFDGEKFYEAESLSTEGFIHCSFEDQLEGVLERYYSGVERVLTLEIDPELLASRLVNEPSTNGEIYPHIYGKINLDAVVAVNLRTIKST